MRHSFNESDWTNFPDACSAKGLEPPEAQGAPWRNPVPSVETEGAYLRGLPHPLSTQDSVTIGSSENNDIVIQGADSLHATLFQNTRDRSWWVYDGEAPSGTYLNGTYVHVAKLSAGDVLRIAGVPILFDGDSLSLDERDAKGVRVTVENLTAHAGGKTLLHNVTFQAREGEFIGILGPSGCGKSTLIQRLVGLAPYSGKVVYNGNDLQACRNMILPTVSYLPQSVEATLHDDLLVEEEMHYFACVRLAEKGNDALADLGLANKRKARVRELSGGEKRRLAIALELLRDPAALLLDEPTAGLDPAASSTVMHMLRKLADQQRTVLCATHVLEDVNLFDRVLLLSPGGYVRFFGKPQDVLSHFFGASFQTKTWADVYRMLAAFDPDFDTPVAVEVPQDSQARPLPAPLPPATFPHAVFSGYLPRMVRLTIDSKKIRESLMTILSPVIIGLVLPVACWKLYESPSKILTVYFCSAIASFWMGLSGFVRPLVAERVPLRCLERLAGVRLRRYIVANLVFALLTSFVQNAIFCAILFLFHPFSEYFVNGAFLPYFGILCGVGIIGSLVGLLVSACSKTEVRALQLMPVVAILALFFSDPVLKSEESQSHTAEPQPDTAVYFVEKHVMPIVYFFEKHVMPTYYPQRLLDDKMQIQAGKDAPASYDKDLQGFVYLLLLYGLLIPLIAFIMQNRRELEWNGR